VNFVPFRREETYLVELAATVQIEPLIGSPDLMILAAAPVEAAVVPVTRVRYFVPFGHFPMVFCAVNFSVTFVVPLPPFHVIFVERVPVILAMGTVTFPDPPAAKPAGVQVRKLDETVPVLAVRLSDVVDANFAQARLGFAAADAGIASGAASIAPAVTARTSPRVRTENFIVLPPG
jgi:hypothetical protein